MSNLKAIIVFPNGNSWADLKGCRVAYVPEGTVNLPENWVENSIPISEEMYIATSSDCFNMTICEHNGDEVEILVVAVNDYLYQMFTMDGYSVEEFNNDPNEGHYPLIELDMINEQIAKRFNAL